MKQSRLFEVKTVVFRSSLFVGTLNKAIFSELLHNL